MGSDPQQPCVTAELRDHKGSIITTIYKPVALSSYFAGKELPSENYKLLLQSLREVQDEANTALTLLITSTSNANSKAALVMEKTEEKVEEVDGESDSADETCSTQKRSKSSPSPPKKKHCN